MPLNYSKWDSLQLSDDSDIEGHPNVDKRSLIRWKQRDIHEKREQRKTKITSLHAEIDCNRVLQPRLADLARSLDPKTNDHPQATFNQVVERLKTQPRPEAPPPPPDATKAGDAPTYDAMVLTLLLQVSEEAKKQAGEAGDVGPKLYELLNKHAVNLAKRTSQLEKELQEELKEKEKFITSEDIHEGFDSKYVPALPEPEPIPGALDTKKPKKKTTTTTFETLNPTPVSSSAPTAPAAESEPKADEMDADGDQEGEEEPTVPELTPVLEGFSRLPLWDCQASWDYIKAHRDVVVRGAQDALLVAAMRAEREGNHAYAKQCVHQSKLLSYCESLGKDGVRVFFTRMVSHERRASQVFVKDVEDTFALLQERVKITREEEERDGAREQIQLVPENPSQKISFNVPGGPPPENLVLEGPETEDLDVEEVRKALQLRWDIFQGLPEPFQAALRKGMLEGVNKRLGEMKVEEAEEIVRLLDVGGIMSFAEGGIRDETGTLKTVEEEDDDGVDAKSKGKEKA